MNYIEVEIIINPHSTEISEIIVAELSEVGFESFVDIENGLQAYIQDKLFDNEILKAILDAEKYTNYQLKYTTKTIPAQNWNAVWESNFDPMFISDQIVVKAPFHNIHGNFKYEILIEPKMSFGTGHHETTSLVMEHMLKMDFIGKTVLDMGCGTGILAILASKMGASDITAIDFDEWAYNNSLENFERNQCQQIKAIMGMAEAIPLKQNDIILANINKNVLLNDIKEYSKVLKSNGLLILSGFYQDDVNDIELEANKNLLFLQDKKMKNNWTACIFKKQ